mgnify:CR=1 FL=1
MKLSSGAILFSISLGNNFKFSSHTDTFLAHVVAVIIFILLAPFSNIPAFLILHVTFSFSLLLHWYNYQEIILKLLLQKRVE